jgi:DNA-binding IclR family transcriptional regulator
MAIQEIVKTRILEILHERPGITHGELAEETGLHVNTITRYMRIIRAEWQGAKE